MIDQYHFFLCPTHNSKIDPGSLNKICLVLLKSAMFNVLLAVTALNSITCAIYSIIPIICRGVVGKAPSPKIFERGSFNFLTRTLKSLDFF